MASRFNLRDAVRAQLNLPSRHRNRDVPNMQDTPSHPEPESPERQRRRLTLFGSSHEVGESSRPSPFHFQEDEVVLSRPELLNCPICQHPLSPPVFQCEEGHLACESCCNNNENICPTCNLPTGHRRCRGIEQVLESAKAPCRNREHGCQMKVTYGMKLEHEKSCVYTTLPCPYDTCIHEFYASVWEDLYTHFSMLHSDSVQNFRMNASITILLDKDTNQVFLQESYGSTLFVLNRITDPLGSLISVICFAPTVLHEKYYHTYRLTARAEHGKIRLRSHVEVALECRSAEPPKQNCLLITSDFADHLERLELKLVIQSRRN